MKVFLGLYMFDKAENANLFFVPPFSFFLVLQDAIFSYLLTFIMDKIFRKKWFFYIAAYVSFPVIYFYVIKGYIIYLYFHGFVNYGLDMFLGSKGNETVNFVLYVLDSYAIAFLVLLFMVSLIFIFFSEKAGKYLEKLKYLPFMIFITALILMPFQLVFSEKFERIERNPAFEVAYTYYKMPQYLPKDIDKTFEPPKELLFESSAGESPKIDINSENRDKNVLFILVESLPYNKKSKALFFNDLEDRSVTFNNFRAFFPGTTRSMIASMCGTYSGTHFSALTRYKTDFNCEPIQKILSENGYRTGLFSAVNLSYDEFDKAEMLKFFDTIEEPKTLTERYTPKKRYGTGNAIEEEIVVDEIVDFMKKDDRPFFVYYYVYWTHSPYEHPFKDIGGSDLEERYDQSLHYVSIAIKKLFNKMRAEGLFDKTLIIATGDHGQAFGQHEGNYTHSNYLYEESIKVPFVIRSSAFPEGKQFVNLNTSHFDIAPTILDYLGMKNPEGWEGQPLLSENYVEKPILIFSRSIVYSDGVLDGKWKYIYSPRENKEELYDLDTDPLEKSNVAENKKNMTDTYNGIIKKWVPYLQNKIINKGENE